MRSPDTGYLEEIDTNSIPFSKKVCWAKEAAEGLCYIHEKAIIQADFGCNNMILTRDDRLKFIDFGGCSIDGEESLVCYGMLSYRLSVPAVSIQTDVFAYGCAVFEIESGRPPYHEHKEPSNSRLVQDLYKENEFPDVGYLRLGRVIQRCWMGKFDAVNEVVQALSESVIRIFNSRD